MMLPIKEMSICRYIHISLIMMERNFIEIEPQYKGAIML